MKVHIDEDKCIGAGQCVLSAEAVFDQRDEDGIAVLLVTDPEAGPDPEHWEGVREAAALCPTGAITLDEA